MSDQGRGWQGNLVFLADVLIIGICYAAAYFIRFDGAPPERYLGMMAETLPLVLAVRMGALIYFRLHSSLRQYASIKDLVEIIKAVSISSVVVVAVLMVLRVGYPRSIFIIDWLLLIIALSGVRFVIRMTRPLRGRRRPGDGHRKKVLIVGAGDAGEMILRELTYRYGRSYEVVGLIDDAPRKLGRHIHGVTVLGARSDIPDIVRNKEVEEIVIAIPSLGPEGMRTIVNYCIMSGASYRTLPNISNVMNGTVNLRELREVSLQDLLKRDEVRLDTTKIGGYMRGKRVLITGAGGSIGSELARQVARSGPEELILFEKSENALFYIEMELAAAFEALKRVPLVGDICDRARVEEVFDRYRPQIIFHAAAHKHVPLMEINSMEAIKNNVLGTQVVAEASLFFGVERFIMLSTDKAVDPTSMMGASKRVAEMYIAAMEKRNGTKFMAVRFGNVMGSEGSVIPIFKKQIERGGPVTVTHPEIKRYFMTIPEAAGLVLEACFMGQGGEVFILEMGRPVKILSMAHDLIRLSGKEVGKDIEIAFTGLRPGEKMHEALVGIREKFIKSPHEKILIIEKEEGPCRNVTEDIGTLKKEVARRNMSGIIGKLKEMVPTYQPSPQVLQAQASLPEERVKDMEGAILIVDDEKIVQDLLGKFLEGKGYNTFLAGSGREALEILKRNHIAMAIIDIRLTGFMNGLHVLKHLKYANKNIEAMTMTGFGTERTKRISRDLGACAHIEKPFELMEIHRHVEDALSKRTRV